MTLVSGLSHQGEEVRCVVGEERAVGRCGLSLPVVPYTATCTETDPGVPTDVMDQKADFEISGRRMDHLQGVSRQLAKHPETSQILRLILYSLLLNY